MLVGLRWLADYMKRYGMKVTVKLPDEEDGAPGRLHDLAVSIRS